MIRKAQIQLRRMGHIALAAGLVFAASCKKTPPPASTGTSAPDARLPMPNSTPVATTKVKGAGMERALEKRYSGNPAEMEGMRNTMSQLDAQIDAEDKLAAIHRRTMVTPAPADFKSEPVARKVRLKLILEKSKIRVGERLRYRLEMTNVGRDAIDYAELRSSIFVKDGGPLDSLTMRFYLTDRRNKRVRLMSPAISRPSADGGFRSNRINPPKGLPKEELEKWFQETMAMGQAHATFKVKLLPGETLHSIGDDDSPRENFKTLVVEDDFDKPGTYRLHLELDDRPRPLSKGYIEASLKSGSTLEEIHKDQERWMRAALGPVSSNVEKFEVVR